MRDLANNELDRVDALPVGSGVLQPYVFGRGALDFGQIGAGVDYSHRINRGLSAFANGEIGYGWGNQSPLGWQALVGMRWPF